MTQGLSDPDHPVLVTGAAGFIGFHLCRRLLADGAHVVGVDSVNDYYSIALKRARLERLAGAEGFSFVECDLARRGAVEDALGALKPRFVAHLAAQAGVRYSLENPHAYVESNITAFVNILEFCRAVRVEHLLYASSSSVYGGNRKLPFSEHDPVDHPVSLYAATKKADELLAHSYAHLYGLPATGLRFFTVYGPWGRPDMAYWKFTDAIIAGEPIPVFNHGEMRRDFTYIDDAVEAVTRIMPQPPLADPDYDAVVSDPARSWAPHRLLNIGNSRREALMDMIRIIERVVGRAAVVDYKPMQPGDVVETWADETALQALTGERPVTTLSDGLPRFVTWRQSWTLDV